MAGLFITSASSSEENLCNWWDKMIKIFMDNVWIPACAGMTIN